MKPTTVLIVAGVGLVGLLWWRNRVAQAAAAPPVGYPISPPGAPPIVTTPVPVAGPVLGTRSGSGHF